MGKPNYKGVLVNGQRLMILAACEVIHMHCSGAGDILHEDEFLRCSSFLRERLESWIPSHPRFERYDEAVRELIKSTLAEVESIVKNEGKIVCR